MSVGVDETECPQIGTHCSPLKGIFGIFQVRV